MTKTPASVARKIGCIDALLFFVIWSLVGTLSVAHPWDSITAWLFLLIPASILVGWRGALSVPRILANSANLWSAAKEGAYWALFFVLCIWLWSTFNSAFAAGGALDGLSPMHAEFWFAAIASLLPISAIAAALGTLNGVALYWINGLLVSFFLRDQ